MYRKIKKDVHILLHPELGETKWDKILNGFIITLIILNVIAVILETVQSIREAYLEFFNIFDFVSVMIFSVEYVLRVWSCTHDPKYKHPYFGRLKYIFSLEGLIDLLAILPYYVHVVVGLDLRILRLLRLFRFLRLFRLTAYMKSAQIIRNIFVKRASELRLSLLLILFLIIIASCMLYFAEHEAQPKVFSSVPASLWWAVVTVTSIGYGDMVPVTVAGKIITGVVTLVGLALLALPAGIITSGFFEELRKSRGKAGHICPHCGKDINDVDH
jgi:voltage-gated potassium channel